MSTSTDTDVGRLSKTKLLWRHARRSMVYGVCILVLASVILGTFLFTCMPRLKEQDVAVLIHNLPPRGLESVKVVRDILLGYAGTYPFRVGTALCLVYIMMQTFAIPGTISLSLLAGALFGSTAGFITVALISTLGSCSCYAMSALFGRPIAHALWPDRLDAFSAEITKRRGDLLSYIIFLRVTPVLPNTFINVASPIVGVPLLQFGIGTLLGCAPNNFVAANAGAHLSELNSLSDLYNPRMLMLCVGVGIVALVPVLIKHRHDRARKLKPT